MLDREFLVVDSKLPMIVVDFSPLLGSSTFNLAATVDGEPTNVAKWTMSRWRHYNVATGVLSHEDPDGRYATFEITIDPPPPEGAKVEVFMVPAK